MAVEIIADALIGRRLVGHDVGSAVDLRHHHVARRGAAHISDVAGADLPAALDEGQYGSTRLISF